jgi:hypothetical protein
MISPSRRYRVVRDELHYRFRIVVGEVSIHQKAFCDRMKPINDQTINECREIASVNAEYIARRRLRENDAHLLTGTFSKESHCIIVKELNSLDLHIT